MTKSISIREAGIADLALILRMEREFDRDHRSIVTRQSNWLRPFLRRTTGVATFVEKRFRRYIRSRNAAIYVAEDSAAPVGFVTISIEKNPPFYPKRFGLVGYLYVRKSHRGRGISSGLMEIAATWLAKRRISNMGLSVMADNRHARRIYKKWGFGDCVVWLWKR